MNALLFAAAFTVSLGGEPVRHESPNRISQGVLFHNTSQDVVGVTIRCTAVFGTKPIGAGIGMARLGPDEATLISVEMLGLMPPTTEVICEQPQVVPVIR